MKKNRAIFLSSCVEQDIWSVHRKAWTNSASGEVGPSRRADNSEFHFPNRIRTQHGTKHHRPLTNHHNKTIQRCRPPEHRTMKEMSLHRGKPSWPVNLNKYDSFNGKRWVWFKALKKTFLSLGKTLKQYGLKTGGRESSWVSQRVMSHETAADIIIQTRHSLCLPWGGLSRFTLGDQENQAKGC